MTKMKDQSVSDPKTFEEAQAKYGHDFDEWSWLMAEKMCGEAPYRKINVDRAYWEIRCPQLGSVPDSYKEALKNIFVIP